MNFAISLKNPKYKRCEIVLRPLHIGLRSKKQTVALHCFNRNKMYPKPKYRIFELFIGKENGPFWVELTIFNFIMSLQVNRWKRI